MYLFIFKCYTISMKWKSKERKTTSLFKKILTIFFVIISLGLQLLLFYELLFGTSLYINQIWFQVIYVIIYIIGIITVAKLYNKNVNSSYKLTWTFLILVLPLFGTICYLLYANGRSMPRRKSTKIRAYLLNRIPKTKTKEDIKDSDPIGYNLLKGLEKSTGLSCYKNTETIFFADAYEKHQRMMEDLKSAQKYIFIEFFIVSDGELLNEVYDVLKEKGEQGIPIYFIYDDVGSKFSFKRKTLKKFIAIPNFQICTYAPFGQNMNPAINYRDHRKIVVIDGKIAYCGGDNLADEYIHKKERFGYWRDNALRLYGEAVKGFTYLFLEMWYMSSKEILPIDDFVYDFDSDPFVKKDDCIVMPFGDGPTYSSNPAYNLFISLISSAQKSIKISTPYFAIDNEFINALARASKNGVEVSILVPGIPDKKSVFYITRSNYGRVLESGGKIYEFSPGFNHAKNIIIDDKYAFIGTTNTDYRSFFLHFECGTFLLNDPSIEKMSKDFDDTIKKSQEILFLQWLDRPIHQKIIELLLTFFSPLL